MLLLFIELSTSFSWCSLPTNIRTLLLLYSSGYWRFPVFIMSCKLGCGAGTQLPQALGDPFCPSTHPCFTPLGIDGVWWCTWLPYLLISPGIWSVAPSRSQLGSPFSWSPPSCPPGPAPTLTGALWPHELCWGFLLWSDGIFSLSFPEIFTFKKNDLG